MIRATQIANALEALDRGAVARPGNDQRLGRAVREPEPLHAGPHPLPEARRRRRGLREPQVAHHLSRFVAEKANIIPDKRHPYVGEAAFSHKAGQHADVISKAPHLMEHIDGALVGNERHVLLSELAGKSTIVKKMARYGEFEKSSEVVSTPARAAQGAGGKRVRVRGGGRVIRSGDPPGTGPVQAAPGAEQLPPGELQGRRHSHEDRREAVRARERGPAHGRRRRRWTRGHAQRCPPGCAAAPAPVPEEAEADGLQRAGAEPGTSHRGARARVHHAPPTASRPGTPWGWTRTSSRRPGRR